VKGEITILKNFSDIGNCMFHTPNSSDIFFDKNLIEISLLNFN